MFTVTLRVRREGDDYVLENGSRCPVWLAPEAIDRDYRVTYLPHPQGRFLVVGNPGGMVLKDLRTGFTHPACFLSLKDVGKRFYRLIEFDM